MYLEAWGWVCWSTSDQKCSYSVTLKRSGSSCGKWPFWVFHEKTSLFFVFKAQRHRIQKALDESCSNPVSFWILDEHTDHTIYTPHIPHTYSEKHHTIKIHRRAHTRKHNYASTRSQAGKAYHDDHHSARGTWSSYPLFAACTQYTVAISIIIDYSEQKPTVHHPTVVVFVV